MRINSRLMVLGLIFIAAIMLSAVIASAIELPDWMTNTWDKISSKGGKSGIKLKQYKWLAVNMLILGAIIMIASPFIVNSLGEDQKKVVQVGLAAVAIMIAWMLNTEKYYPQTYLWKIPMIANLLHMKVIINILVVAVVLYFIYTYTKIQEKFANNTMGKIICAILIFMIAMNMATADMPKVPDPKRPGKLIPEYDAATYKYIWDKESWVRYRFMLFGDPECYYYDIDNFGFGNNGLLDKTFKGPDGNKYFKKGNTIRQDGWFINHKASAEMAELYNKADTARNLEVQNRLDEHYKQNAAVTKRIGERRSQLTPLKEELLGKIGGRKEVDRYCYTQESIKEFISQKNADPDAEVRYSKKEPGWNELTGFGILRGNHLVILVMAFLLFLWMFKTYIRIGGGA